MPWFGADASSPGRRYAARAARLAPDWCCPSQWNPTKPRLIINAIPLNDCCRHVNFTMETVSRVPIVVEDGAFMGSLDDKSGSHNLGL